MYACGITTYDEAHLGHASQAIFFDVIRSYLEYRGYRVRYVRNYTDIDDKIIDRAATLGQDPLALSAHYIAETREDLAAVGVRPATIEPKVTDHIPDIIAFIEGLIAKGYAYKAGGDVLFSVAKFPEYGKLSGQRRDELVETEAAGRGPQGAKRDPADFALWKAAKPGEPSWPSPWGPGRPGP